MRNSSRIPANVEARSFVDSIEKSRPPVTSLKSRRKLTGCVADLDAIHDHVAAAGCFDDGIGGQPAGRVHAVAEDDQEGAARIRFAEEHARVRRIDERREPLTMHPIECEADAIEVVGQTLARRHDVAECDERRAIAGLEAFEGSLTCRLQMTEPQALKTGAVVERKDDVQWNLFEAREVYALADAVVEYLEIRR